MSAARPVALVTGGQRGLGAVIARRFAREGYDLVVNYERDEAAATRFVEDLSGSTAVELAVGDVSVPAQADAVVERALARFGRVDVLVNNAGVSDGRTLGRLSPEWWGRVIDVNLTGTLNMVRAVAPSMKQRRHGSIVNVSSVVGFTGGIGLTGYAAAKLGVIGLTRSVALEMARYAVRVNVVCPGYFEAGMLYTIPEPIQADLLRRIPLGRFGNPEELAGCVLFLARDAEYLTGQTLHVNGGLVME